MPVRRPRRRTPRRNRDRPANGPGTPSLVPPENPTNSMVEGPERHADRRSRDAVERGRARVGPGLGPGLIAVKIRGPSRAETVPFQGRDGVLVPPARRTRPEKPPRPAEAAVEPTAASGVPAAMTRHRRPITRHLGALAAASFAVIVAACFASGAASPASSAPPTGPGSGAPSPSATPPSASPSVVPAGTIDHPTGATDVILRYDEGGGVVMPAFAATMVPWFTLYGDGTMIFRNPNLEPPPAQGSVMPQGPMRVARLD